MYKIKIGSEIFIRCRNL